MSADRHLLLFCADCGDDRPFEQPPCIDDHGADCPEWACVDCGAAILLGPTPAEAATAAVAAGTTAAGTATAGTTAAGTTTAGTAAGTTAGAWAQPQRRGGDDHPGDGLHRRYVA